MILPSIGTDRHSSASAAASCPDARPDSAEAAASAPDDFAAAAAACAAFSAAPVWCKGANGSRVKAGGA